VYVEAGCAIAFLENAIPKNLQNPAWENVYGKIQTYSPVIPAVRIYPELDRMPQNQSSKKQRPTGEQRSRRRTQVILLVLSVLLILSMVISLAASLQ
jgi:hypothetical protein